MKHALAILLLSASVVFGQTLTNTNLDGVTNATLNGVLDNDAAATRTALGLGTAATADKSTTGGVSKIPQLDTSGNFQTGPFANTGTTFGDAGNIIFPDQQGLRWMKPDGTMSTAGIRLWGGHDAQGGEFIFDAPWRMAFIADGPVQFGSNASVRDAMYLHLVAGSTTDADPLRSSKAISLQTISRTGGVATSNHLMIQAVPLDTSGTNSVVRWTRNAVVTGSEGGYTATNGDVTGTVIGELGKDGFWSNGTAPVFDVLTDGATVTQTCSKFKAVQSAKLTLAGNRTLAISGALSGMRGIIYVIQDATGNRTLTLPASSATATSWALSTTADTIDRMAWEFDGTTYFWTIDKGIEMPLDADATAFLSAGRANIADATQRKAVNTLVLALKANSIWNKFHSIYPFIGGNSTAHSKNLIADSLNIAWGGAPTHDANGVTGDGTSAYGNTGLKWSAVSGQNNCSGYVYCKTITPTTSGQFFGAVGTSSSRFGIYPTGPTNIACTGPNWNSIGTIAASAGSDFRKHFALNRSASNASQLIVEATSYSNSGVSLNACDANIYLLAQDSTGTANAFSNATLGLAAFGQSLTTGEWTTFRGIVDTFQAALARANP